MSGRDDGVLFDIDPPDCGSIGRHGEHADENNGVGQKIGGCYGTLGYLR